MTVMTITRQLKSTLLSALILFLGQQSFADIRLPAIIGSHMVLQQNAEVTLWGWCDPGEKVIVQSSWDTTHFLATGESTARWKLSIKTPAAGGPFTISINGKNKIALEDVLVGEVWLCSGQSNMEMNVTWGLPYDQDVVAATNQKIRFFHIPRVTSEYPQDDTRGRWVVCNPDDMKLFSAVGYFFGNRLQKELAVPVGLINASWGGTPAEVWTPADTVLKDESLKTAAAKLKPAPGWPVLPGLTYNAMIAPITPYKIAGAIWYQGESNVTTYTTYTSLLTTMIGSWRSLFKTDFPFYLVQIAPYSGYVNNDLNRASFLREAQTNVLKYPRTGMVVISDLVDDVKDIHPKLKKEVGLRLADYALADTYKKQGFVYRNPLYRNMEVVKNKIRLYFDHADNGFVTKGGAPTEFYVAGVDQKFVPATATIEKSSILVYSKDVKEPVAVRFGFSNAAMPNLFSKEGLPVNSFRTDTWPGAPAGLQP